MHHARACALEKRVQNYCFFLKYARKRRNILGIRTNDAVLAVLSSAQTLDDFAGLHLLTGRPADYLQKMGANQ